MGLFVIFEPSQLTVKSNEVFFIGVSLLLSLSARSSRKKVVVGKFADRITPSVTGLGGYNINKEQKEIAKTQRNEVFKWLFKMIFSMTAFHKYIAERSVIGKNEQVHIYESSKNFSRSSFSVMTGMDGLIASRLNIEYPYPLLILAGEKDITLAITSAQSWHQDIPTNQFEIIQNAGHCANLDNALEFNKRLKNFLQLKNSEN